jgi:actin related protein 2/3 complex subunit 1A/1B
VSKHVKKPLRSTVLSIDWHPNNVLLAAGTADAKAYVFSSFIKGVDAKPEATVWGDRLPFNTVCGDFKAPNGGWVHDVAFSPSGNILGYVSHDSAVNLVYPDGPGLPPQAHISVRTQTLPYLSLTFTSEESLIAAGHDCQPTVFAVGANGWELSHSLDDPAQAGSRGLTPNATGSRGPAPGRLNNEAFQRFRQADSRGQTKPGLDLISGPGTAAVGPDGHLLTVHQNSITIIQPYEWAQTGEATKVYTAGKDGRLVIWPVTPKSGGLAGRMANLAV